MNILLLVNYMLEEMTNMMGVDTGMCHREKIKG